MNKEEMYEYLEWMVKKIAEDERALDWIGDEDCGCRLINDTRTEEDIKKGLMLDKLCNYIVKLDEKLSKKITNKYNKFEIEKYGDDNFLSVDCVCFKYKDNYYFINDMPYFGGQTNLSIISEFEAKEYGFIEL